MDDATCPVCQTAFTVDRGRRGRRQIYCAKTCNAQAVRDRKSKRKQESRRNAALPCKVCGGAVNVHALGPVPKFCSTNCADVSRGVRLPEPLADRLCALPECGVTFRPAARNVRCCSERHGKILYNRESRADGRQALPMWDDKARARWAARQALKRGVAAEVFEFREVFDRDGWICGLCAEPVDPELRWPDPLSVSLDHVIPLSRGGSHSRANTQCSHLRCNVSKGAAA